MDWNATHRLWLFVACGVFALLMGGSSALMRLGSIGNRSLGGLALLAAVTLLAVVGLYLYRPATLRRPPEPTLREDLRDLALRILDDTFTRSHEESDRDPQVTPR